MLTGFACQDELIGPTGVVEGFLSSIWKVQEKSLCGLYETCNEFILVVSFVCTINLTILCFNVVF